MRAWVDGLDPLQWYTFWMLATCGPLIAVGLLILFLMTGDVMVPLATLAGGTIGGLIVAPFAVMLGIASGR